MKRILLILLAAAILAALAYAAYLAYTYKSLNVPRTEAPDFAAEPLPFALPEGFAMSVFAEGVKGARTLAFDPSGALLVAQTSEGRIMALPDTDGDGKADAKVLVADGLDRPHGLAFRCTDPSRPTECVLYVAEEDMLSSYEYNAEAHRAVGRRELLPLPDAGAGGHHTRSLHFMPYPDDSTLLVSVGSSCNACAEDDARRAAVLTYDVETGASGVFATGLRNAVFLAPHPVTGEVWATEMGRDGLGDDTPPDEMNIVKEGGFYGWPWYYGKNVRDDTHRPGQAPEFAGTLMGSHVDLQAHSAPLGFAFVPEEGWPEEYWFDALVAYHGSWNRSEPTGYKIARIDLDDEGNYRGVEDFITGWLRPDGTLAGRPADVKALPGGTLYVSDDGAGVVYRVGRTEAP